MTTNHVFDADRDGHLGDPGVDAGAAADITELIASDAAERWRRSFCGPHCPCDECIYERAELCAAAALDNICLASGNAAHKAKIEEAAALARRVERNRRAALLAALARELERGV